MPTARNADVTIHYEEYGVGAPILLIHGHTLDHRIFDLMAEEGLTEGLKLIVPDLRGHGRSTRPESGYHFSHHAADMAAVLDAIGADTASVLGFSVGGGVALEMAVTMPERVENLILMAPVMPDRRFDPEFMANLKEVAKTIRSEGLQQAMEGPWKASPLFRHSLTKPGVEEKLVEIVRDFPGAEYLATERDQIDREWKLPDRLNEIEARTLVVVGGAELAGFRAFADEAAENMPSAILEVVDGCGHLLPLEAPAECAELVKNFLMMSA